MSAAVREAAWSVAEGIILAVIAAGIAAGIIALVAVVTSAPAPASPVSVPAAFCPAGLHVVPAPYLAREPSDAPLCAKGATP